MCTYLVQQWRGRAAGAHRQASLRQGLQACHEGGKIRGAEGISKEIKRWTDRAYKIWKLRHLHRHRVLTAFQGVQGDVTLVAMHLVSRGTLALILPLLAIACLPTCTPSLHT